MKFLYLATLTILLTACGSMPSKSNQMFNSAMQRFNSCVDDPTVAKKSSCAKGLYDDISRMPNEDYGKAPALKYVTEMYRRVYETENGKISKQQADYEMMKVSNDFTRELAEARTRSDAANRDAALARQQLFLNLQKSLQPPVFQKQCPQVLNAKPGAYGADC